MGNSDRPFKVSGDWSGVERSEHEDHYCLCGRGSCAHGEADRYRALLAEFASHGAESNCNWIDDWTRRVHEALDE